jgi:pimeloyl-ACP methyl ester carboxylesterase
MKTGTTLLISLAMLAAGAAPVRADPVTLNFGDTTLTGNLELADGKTLADGVALITHGTLGHSKMDIIQSLQGGLLEAGHSSLIINLSLGDPDREFMYDCKVPHRHSHHEAMAEIAAWANWLVKEGATSISVIGHSRGGNQTAWYAAEQAHANVKKVVLVAPATWSAKAQAEGYQKRYGRDLNTVVAKAKAMADSGQGDEMMTATGFVYCSNAEVTANSFLSYYLPDERRNTPSLLLKITLPTLVVAGSEDKVVTGLAEQLENKSPGDHVRLESVDGAGHFFRDLYGEDLSDLIVEFLEN